MHQYIAKTQAVLCNRWVKNIGKVRHFCPFPAWPGGHMTGFPLCGASVSFQKSHPVLPWPDASNCCHAKLTRACLQSSAVPGLQGPAAAMAAEGAGAPAEGSGASGMVTKQCPA